MRSFRSICAAAGLAIAAPAMAAERSAAEWSQVAVDDLHYIRAALRENHPGPIDAENPAFRTWFVRGFDESLALARRAKSYAGYYFAIQKYVVGFQDGHLGALGDDRLAADIKLQRQWPGFVLGFDQGRFMVVDSVVASPTAGAILEGCDGISADALADQLLRPYLPLWTLRGTRFRTAPFLLIDEGNPFVSRPRTCMFRDGPTRRSIRLQWRLIARDDLAKRIQFAQGKGASTTAIRPFGDGGQWISLASFNANSDADSAPLRDVIRALEAEPQRFRDAKVLVFDVRGNTGGNSEFGNRIAAAIWGRPFVETVPGSTTVDWRLSRLNLRQLERSNLPALETRFGRDDPNTKAFATFVAAYRAAFERGEKLYREPIKPRVAKVTPAPGRAKVFLLTDGWCHSACLDFADLILSVPGVTHVGAETSADTVYIDNSGWYLPSGEGSVGWSMKVHRGRPRGHNVSYVPQKAWIGPLSDTAGLEKWIAGLSTAMP